MPHEQPRLDRLASLHQVRRSVQHLKQVELLDPAHQHRVMNEVHEFFVADTEAVTALVFDVWAPKGRVVEFAASIKMWF